MGAGKGSKTKRQVERLTDLAVQALKPEAKEYSVTEDKFHGGCFGVRVSPRGLKVFFVRYRNAQGRHRRLKLGVYPAVSLADARDEATKEIGTAFRGGDPAAQRHAVRHGDTFRDLWEDYLENDAKRKKTESGWKADIYKAEKELLPSLGHLKIAAITKRDCAVLIQKIANRPRYHGSRKGADDARKSTLENRGIHANRVLSLLKRIFNYGIEVDLCENNPAYKLKKPGRERKRTRVLAADEIRAVWAAIEKECAIAQAAFKTWWFTGQRESEVFTMEWGEVDLDEGLWSIPEHKTKNKQPHLVPLSPQVVIVLRSIRPVTGLCRYVFPSYYAGTTAGHVGHLKSDTPVGLDTAAKRVRAASGVPDMKPRDYRRTMSTHMAEFLDVTTFDIGKTLNHIDQNAAITERYNLYRFTKEKRLALNKWGLYLERILGGDDSLTAAGAALAAFPAPLPHAVAPTAPLRQPAPPPVEEAAAPEVMPANMVRFVPRRSGQTA